MPMLKLLRKNKLFAVAMILNIIALSSCQGAAVEELLKGEVNLTLASTTEIEVKSEVSHTSLDNYRFKFSGVDEYGSSDYYIYGDVVMPMEWYFGIYTLYAESCTKEEAEQGYGCVRYEGESGAFAVINDEVSSVSVMCRVANCRVNVKFDDTMYESFDGFKLEVRTLYAPEEDDDAKTVDENPEVLRKLEFDPINHIGYYNIQDKPLNLYYTLYVINSGATEYIESISGYLMEGEVPAVIKAADAVTFNVKYVGDPIVTPNIKFVVNGERSSVENSIILGEYNQGSIVEDN